MIMSGPKNPDFGRAYVDAFLHDPKPRLKPFLDDIERTVILAALGWTGGNQVEASRLLGVKYTTLNEKIKRYRIWFDRQPIY